MKQRIEHRKNVWMLADQLKGKDVYILGSGKSLDFLPKDFFADKATIGLNYVYKQRSVDFTVSMHHEVVEDAVAAGQTVCATVRDALVLINTPKVDRTWFFFKHTTALSRDVIMSFLKKDYNIVGNSSVISAMGLAYILGAKNIILCGVDCGIIDGEKNADGYSGKAEYDADFFSSVEAQIESVSSWMREKGIGVCSINPFVTMRLEGHTFKQKETKDGFRFLRQALRAFDRR